MTGKFIQSMEYCMLGMNEGEDGMVWRNLGIKQNMGHKVLLKYCLLSKNKGNYLVYIILYTSRDARVAGHITILNIII